MSSKEATLPATISNFFSKEQDRSEQLLKNIFWEFFPVNCTAVGIRWKVTASI